MILNWETAELDPVTSGDEAIRARACHVIFTGSSGRDPKVICANDENAQSLVGISKPEVSSATLGGGA